jgi:Spy/CpxP family protein refolding chaperone
MNLRKTLLVTAAAFALSMPAFSFGADDPPAPPPAQQQPPRGGRGFGRNALTELVSALGELNLSPDFSLSSDQKSKIQSIRDDFKKQSDQWRADHAADLKKLQDQRAELRNAGPDAQDKRQELTQASQQLYASAPSGDEAAKLIQAVLTADQGQKLADEQAKIAKERQDAAARFGGGAGGRGGRRGGAGAGAAGN